LHSHSQPAAPTFLTGVIAPMFTPRHADGRLDLDGARSFVRWLQSRKCVRSVFVRSGVGDMYAFTMDEARSLFAVVLAEAGGKIGVLAGCVGEFDGDPEHRPDPARYTAQAVALSQHAQERGADAVVLVLPSALAPTPGTPLEDTIFAYYRAVNDAVSIPIIAYQPQTTPPEYCMTPSLMRRLLTLPRIGGMKLSTTDHGVFDPIARVVAGTGFAMIAGAEHFYLNALTRGAVGVIGGGCNTHPEMIYAVEHHYRAGRLDRAHVAQGQVNATLQELEALGIHGAIAGKLYIAAQGYPMEPYDKRRRELPPVEAVRRFAEIVDRRVAEYRGAVQGGTDVP